MIRNLDDIRVKLKTFNWALIARDIKVPYVTVQRVLNGSVSNPSYNVFIKLHDWAVKNA